jgi:hypothetical protein
VRTTVNIDDRLLEWAKNIAREKDQTLGEVIDAALQRHLMQPGNDDGGDLPIFRPRVPGFLPGIDPLSNQSLFDAADDPAEPLK